MQLSWARSGRLIRSVLVLVLAVGVAAPALATIKQSSPDGFLMEWSDTIAAPPERVYGALLQWGQWWNAEHSYSGAASNFTLDPHAGGCLCERWGQASVEHGRVLMAMPDQLLRLEAPFGPLQGQAVRAILTFRLEPVATGTLLTTTFRVSGGSQSALDRSAPPVHAVMSEGWQRLARFVVTGKPTE